MVAIGPDRRQRRRRPNRHKDRGRMRLVVQIPCFNEEETIAAVVADIRRATAAFDDVKILVIDDGSRDGTVAAARAAGVDYIARHYHNEGLAYAFMTGLAASLNVGADIIVNTDADNQYRAEGIPELVAPVAAEKADMAVGARPIRDTEHFSPVKKMLQALGSFTVSMLSGTPVADATSGFRAMNRETAIRLNTFSKFTYTLETLIQAGRSRLRVVSVPIETNDPTRPSRLFRSIRQYVTRSMFDMLRVFTVYAPLRTYGFAGIVPVALAVLIGIRFLALITFIDPTRTHMPSLILAAILAAFGFIMWAIGILGELLSINRRILEELRTEQRRARAEAGTMMGRCRFDLIDVGAGA